jgi:hypothetical protein
MTVPESGDSTKTQACDVALVRIGTSNARCIARSNPKEAAANADAAVSRVCARLCRHVMSLASVESRSYDPMLLSWRAPVFAHRQRAHRPGQDPKVI